MTFNKMLVNKIKYILPCLFALFVIGAHAEEGSGKIAVVDLERAIMQTDVAKKVVKEFKSQKTVGELYKDFDEKNKVYEKAAEKYTKNRSVMSKTKLEEAEIELSNLRDDVQYVGTKLQKNEDALRKQIIQQAVQLSAQVVENIVKEQKIGLLLRAGSGAIAHADSSYDISNQVTERLNQMSKK